MKISKSRLREIIEEEIVNEAKADESVQLGYAQQLYDYAEKLCIDGVEQNGNIMDLTPKQLLIIAVENAADVDPRGKIVWSGGIAPEMDTGHMTQGMYMPTQE
jgi:hypothetical protein